MGINFLLLLPISCLDISNVYFSAFNVFSLSCFNCWYKIYLRRFKFSLCKCVNQIMEHMCNLTTWPNKMSFWWCREYMTMTFFKSHDLSYALFILCYFDMCLAILSNYRIISLFFFMVLLSFSFSCAHIHQNTNFTFFTVDSIPIFPKISFFRTHKCLGA